MTNKDRIIDYAINFEFTDNYKVIDYKIINGEKDLFLTMTIKYKNKITHDIKLIEKDGELLWYLSPYQSSFTEHQIYSEEDFNLILLAILEHTDLHKYS